MPNARYRFLQEVQQLPRVRLALEQRRNRMAVQAQQIARAENVTSPFVLSEGTRPRGRSYARLGIRAEDEFGDSRTRRSRILGRVARS